MKIANDIIENRTLPQPPVLPRAPQHV